MPLQRERLPHTRSAPSRSPSVSRGEGERAAPRRVEPGAQAADSGSRDGGLDAKWWGATFEQAEPNPCARIDGAGEWRTASPTAPVSRHRAPAVVPLDSPHPKGAALCTEPPESSS
ncbi:hypothetical protein GCM10010246_45850 [Streptomyces cuspidosporus]|uniref:Uncharacterized protein n=1 Tax=Streptomyces cuspidosporus TaxID=66882 RepID=A0ABP5TGF8_9ACTN